MKPLSYADMQSIAVHHLLHNEIVMNNEHFMNYLTQNNGYFEAINQLRRQNSESHGVHPEPQQNGGDCHMADDEHDHSLLENAQRCLRQLEDTAPLQGHQLIAIYEQLRQILREIDDTVTTLNDIFERSMRRIKELSEQLNHVEELAGAIHSSRNARADVFQSKYST